MKKDDDFLIISESFYSIQGEGASLGVPAVFLRLRGCNLNCNGFSYKSKTTSRHLGCDTKDIWELGKKKKFEEIISEWETNGWLNRLREGAHLIITGGEPTLQQMRIMAFLRKIDQIIDPKIYVEIETNATRRIDHTFLARLDQVNASPKLSSSGENRIKAYFPDILAELSREEKTKFKFVVIKEDDINEIINNYVIPFKIKTSNIWLMPEGGTKKAIKPKILPVVELCKKHLMNYTPRLQVDIWNQTTGV